MRFPAVVPGQAGRIDKWAAIGGKLSVALLQRFEDAEKVRLVCEDIRLTNKDTHLLYSQVGERLGLVPERTVAAAFTTLWAHANYHEAARLIDGISKGSVFEKLKPQAELQDKDGVANFEAEISINILG